MYYINDGGYGSFNCSIMDPNVVVHVTTVPPRRCFYYDDDHTRTIHGVNGEQVEEEQQLYRSVVWGPTGDGLDCVLPSCWLPDLAVGQWLVFEEMGAYSCVIATCFNGFPRPYKVYVAPPSLHKGLGFRAVTTKTAAATKCAGWIESNKNKIDLRP